MSDPRDGEPMFQIEGFPTLERMRKEHPFTLWGMEQVDRSLLALVSPKEGCETWTCVMHSCRADPVSSPRVSLVSHRSHGGAVFKMGSRC